MSTFPITMPVTGDEDDAKANSGRNEPTSDGSLVTESKSSRRVSQTRKLADRPAGVECLGGTYHVGSTVGSRQGEGMHLPALILSAHVDLHRYRRLPHQTGQIRADHSDM